MMTAEATARAPAGEAGFRLLAEQLPDIVLLTTHFGLIAMQERVEARLPLTDPIEGLRL
jgi:hypothetical protein